MLKRLLLVLPALIIGYSLIVQLAGAQAPNATESAPPAPQLVAEQIDSLLRSAVQQILQRKPEDAASSARQALALSQQIDDLTQQRRATNLLAMACVRLGKTGEAIRRFKEAAAIASQANDKNNEALALTRAGIYLRVTGLYDEALNCFDSAIAIFRQTNDRSGEARALGSLSTVYSETGDFENARRLVQQALPIARELKDKVLDETLLLRLGIVEEECGHHDLALQLGLQALAIDDAQDFDGAMRDMRRAFEQTMEPQLQPLAQTRLELFLHLGIVYSSLNDDQKAAEFFQRALTVFDVRPLVTAVLQGNLAGAQLHLGKATEARDLAIKAIAGLRNSGGSKHWEATFLYYLAEANRALGMNDEALNSYRQAIDAIEQARSLSIPTEVSRAGIVAARHKVFAGAIDFFLSQQRTEEALATAEAWHARAFLDILTESRIDLTKDLSVSQREQENKIFARISSVQKELWNPGVATARETELKTQLVAAENALEDFQLALRRANPRYASVKYPRPLKAEQMAKGLLAQNTALIEFVLGEEKSFAFVIYSGRVASVTLPSRKNIDELIGNYRAALSERVSTLTVKNANTRIKVLSAQLYQKLFAPLESHLAGAQKLVIVPDGPLLYLPFETLKRDSAGGDYLVERFAISYAPSATVLGVIQGTKRGEGERKGLVAFGDPSYANAKHDQVATAGANSQSERRSNLTQLPYARNEVAGIASLFPLAERRTFFGADAQEEKVKSEDLSHARYVHFAVHGVIDEAYPMRSGILLATTPDSKEDGTLQLNEVMLLRLNADVVTLSACGTGLGKLLNGEGMIGLTRAFQYAGADDVVVSLWNVNDMATAELMKLFYQNLTRGLTKGEALRQAKLQLLQGKQKPWVHPYYWAAFVLVGADD